VYDATPEAIALKVAWNLVPSNDDGSGVVWYFNQFGSVLFEGEELSGLPVVRPLPDPEGREGDAPLASFKLSAYALHIERLSDTPISAVR
jgi:hypothetical protein